jgi:CRISPR-associated endonuclease/helicase Cas3
MLAKWAGDNLEPWASGVWSYSMVKVATRLLARIDPPSEPAARIAYDRLHKTLPGEGKWCGLLPLSRRADGVWQGQAWTAGNEKSGKNQSC